MINDSARTLFKRLRREGDRRTLKRFADIFAQPHLHAEAITVQLVDKDLSVQATEIPLEQGGLLGHVIIFQHSNKLICSAA